MEEEDDTEGRAAERCRIWIRIWLDPGNDGHGEEGIERYSQISCLWNSVGNRNQAGCVEDGAVCNLGAHDDIPLLFLFVCFFLIALHMEPRALAC